MQPLEYWNFEKVEVTRQEDGEVKIIHQKQDPDFQSIRSKVVDCSMAHRSQLGLGVTLTADLLGNASLSRPPKGRNKVKKSAVGSLHKPYLGNAGKETQDEDGIQGQTNEKETDLGTSGSPKRKKDTRKATLGSPVKAKRRNAAQPRGGKRKASMAPTNKPKRKPSPIKATRDEAGRHPALSPTSAKGRVNTQELLAAWSPNRTPISSPSKKKLFSPQDDFLDTPAEEETTFRRRMKGGEGPSSFIFLFSFVFF